MSYKEKGPAPRRQARKYEVCAVISHEDLLNRRAGKLEEVSRGRKWESDMALWTPLKIDRFLFTQGNYLSQTQED